ncbi:hypothetical protein [Sphingobacterium paludis]|jgi:hypothetical protein|uniref:Uncharacterized protein n=1 Tax=Sphingobacterium paludis TaxID=1476465 RepID=A0A4R7D335_9SPHI|nr:hypothetical protein [Sphingobacterium paludis]TDS14511.1 hypothetical protein B0I21_1033 [Sphingobacterium paludis]
MLHKLIHFLVLLSYLNILGYEASANIPEIEDDYLLNGESLLEFVLDDVLDLPVNKETDDVEIRYEEYRAIPYSDYILPIFVLILGTLFLFRPPTQDQKHPVYDAKKRQIIPGYYAFLYRLKPF